ncbi:unnamed protein product [Caenorhabditis angaria]|uniref:Arrestin C-terminal-like domain-containing protein n=1 Tax=Caenorhabditis angaria TaxID=860376 RepID=A0A9P1MW94_9PELO|nr:unnamed protein product [Caenorhabditis angaria]
MANIQVDFENTSMVFSPGQIVAGNITVDVPDDFKARKICVELCGKAYTFWEGEVKNTKVKNLDIVRVRHNCADHKAKIVYAKDELIVWRSEDQKNEIAAGSYVFKFSFALPNWCPPSFEGDIGFIRYCIKVEIDRPWKFDDKFVRGFTVIPRIDLAQIPNSQFPSKRHICEESGSILFKRGVVRLEVKLLRQGFVCGEQIPVEIQIENDSNKKFGKILWKLVQRVTYTGFRDGFVDSETCQQRQKVQYSTRVNAQIRVEERKFFEKLQDVKIEENTKHTINENMTIPSLPPTIKSCDIISVEYFLKIKLTSSGTFSKSIKVECPFIIGTENSLKIPDPEIESIRSYKRSIFGFNSTRLKNRSLQKFAPFYPVYNLTL